MTDTYLSVRETASRLSLCPATIYGWIKQGLVPAIQTPGGVYRIPESFIRNYPTVPARIVAGAEG
jgi:excisionase family DNA binding protein